MDRHLRQCASNLEFHGCMEEHFATRFYDWKITALFYCALHYMHAIANKHGKQLSHVHRNMLEEIDPQNRNGKLIDLPPAVFRAYCELKRNSEMGRYNGMTQEPDQYQILMKENHGRAQRDFGVIKGYVARPNVLAA